MLTVPAIVIFVVFLMIVNIKTGIYRSAARLINSDKIDARIKWQIVARWGARAV